MCCVLIFSIIFANFSWFLFTKTSIISSIKSSSIIEKVDFRKSSERCLSTENCSKSVSASRIPPRESFAISSMVPGSAVIFSASITKLRRSAIFFSEIFWKSNRCARERIVSGTLSISVVAKINLTCSGGSSSVLRSALNALFPSICTSSIIYTLNFPKVGKNFASSIIARILSTSALLAPSISIISIIIPFSKAWQFSHALHGFPSCKLRQLKLFARIRALVVFPVPRDPVKIYACPVCPFFRLLRKIFTIKSCPTTESQSFGRYFV